MRLIWKAVRAVALETLGVVGVVWLLFAGVGMTVQDNGRQHNADPGRALDWAQEATEEIADVLRPELDDDDRERYVEEKLGRYSAMYRQAAADYIERTAQELAREVGPRGRHEVATGSNLFRSL